MSIEAGKAKAAALRKQHKRYAAGHFFSQIELTREHGTTADMKKLQEHLYDMPRPNPGMLWNPTGRRLAHGSSGKCDRISSGYRAKQAQGRGL